jgi:hypothetical protein
MKRGLRAQRIDSCPQSAIRAPALVGGGYWDHVAGGGLRAAPRPRSLVARPELWRTRALTPPVPAPQRQLGRLRVPAAACGLRVLARPGGTRSRIEDAVPHHCAPADWTADATTATGAMPDAPRHRVPGLAGDRPSYVRMTEPSRNQDQVRMHGTRYRTPGDAINRTCECRSRSSGFPQRQPRRRSCASTSAPHGSATTASRTTPATVES